MVVNTPEGDKKEGKGAGKSGFIDEKLFKSRAITIFGEINDKIARSVTEKLLALAADGDDHDASFNALALSQVNFFSQLEEPPHQTIRKVRIRLVDDPSRPTRSVKDFEV